NRALLDPAEPRALSRPDSRPPRAAERRRLFLRSAERAGRRKSARDIRLEQPQPSLIYADQSDRARARVVRRAGHPSRAVGRSYREDLNPVRSRDLPLCSGSCVSLREADGFEPSVPSNTLPCDGDFYRSCAQNKRVVNPPTRSLSEKTR